MLREKLEHVLAIHQAGQLDDAERLYAQLTREFGEHPDVLHLSGVLWMQRGDLVRAIPLIERAIFLNPKALQYHVNAGAAHRALGHMTESIQHYRIALALKPDNADAHNNLGNALQIIGASHEAIQHYKLSLSSSPTALTFSNLLYTLNLLPHLDQAEVLGLHRQYARLFGAQKAESHFSHNIDPERPLRVGYVSSDFRTHSVAFFLSPLFKAHDPAQFSIYCYSEVAREDQVTEEFRRRSSGWYDMKGRSDAEVAARIGADEIDILVDLNGHTQGNRLGVFARKPVPIAMSWLGYPNTTGLDAIDYRLTDATADPEGQDAFYVEQLLRLPEGFLCYEPLANAPAVQAPPSERTGKVTFGSFNNVAKVHDLVIEIWSRVMQTVPGSRLLLKSLPFEDSEIRRQYVEKFHRHGIAPERIALVGQAAELEHHFALYGDIDVALDPFPYNGTTTTCEALWMGVPVITLAGDRHSSRVGASLLTRVGLTDLIARNPEAYVEIARALSTDAPRLRAFRVDMRSRMLASSLCNARVFASSVESAYRSVWKTYCGQQTTHGKP